MARDIARLAGEEPCSFRVALLSTTDPDISANRSSREGDQVGRLSRLVISFTGERVAAPVLIHEVVAELFAKCDRRGPGVAL